MIPIDSHDASGLVILGGIEVERSIGRIMVCDIVYQSQQIKQLVVLLQFDCGVIK